MPFFGPDGRDHLGVGVELDAEPAQVERGDRLAELGDALARRVPVVLRIVDGFGQLLDRGVGRGQVGVAEPEVDDVAPGSTGRQLQRLDVREDVRGQAVDPSELHRARLVPGLRASGDASAPRRRHRRMAALRACARRRPPRPRPRSTRATRTPPTWPRPRPPPPATARSRGPLPPPGRPTSPRSAAWRPATAAGWPSHRLTARAELDGELDGGGRPTAHPHRHTRLAAGAGAHRRSANRRSSAGSKGIPKARFSAALLLSPVPSPAMSRPGAMCSQRQQLGHEDLVGDEPDARHQRAEADPAAWRRPPPRARGRRTGRGARARPWATGGRTRTPRRGRAPRPAARPRRRTRRGGTWAA